MNKVKQLWESEKSYIAIINGNLSISNDGWSYTDLKVWMENYGTNLMTIEVENNKLVFKTIK